LQVPVLITEQNPSRLGNTVSEIDTQGHVVYEKTLFSMITPDVDKFLQEKKPESAVIFGLEVHSDFPFLLWVSSLLTCCCV